MNYYDMFVKEDKRYGVAYVPEGTPLFLLPRTGGWVEDWQEMVLTLRKGDFSDYLANDMAFPLCSRKLRDIMEGCKGEQDVFQWLPVTVRSKGGEEREYFVLHFPQEYDVLDKERSIYDAHGIIKPVISQGLAVGHHIFTFIGAEGVGYYVSEKVRRKVLREKCIGVTFERTAVAD